MMTMKESAMPIKIYLVLLCVFAVAHFAAGLALLILVRRKASCILKTAGFRL